MVASATWTVKEKSRRLETMALKFEGTTLSGVAMSQKFDTRGDLTKGHLLSMKNPKAKKVLCPYGVAPKDLKDVIDVAMFLSELLKYSKVKVDHLQHKKTKVAENLIGHRFIMADHKH